MNFTNDMLTKYGIELELELSKRNLTPDGYYDNIREFLIDEIESVNHTVDLTDNIYTDVIYRAVCEQAKYELANPNLDIATGINFQTGQVMPTHEIAKRLLSPRAKRILANAGLFYVGLSIGGDAYDKRQI